MLLEFLILVIALLSSLLVYANIRPANYPPGPITLPYVGHLIHFALSGRNGIHKLLTKYVAKYGKVFAVDFGYTPVVVISDVKLLREVFSDNVASGRPKLYSSSIRVGDAMRGIILNDGPNWQEQRRFTIRHLRDFGFGKTTIESLVVHEAKELLEGFEKDAGQPVSTEHVFNLAVLNTLWTITAGERFRHDDPQLMEIMNIFSRLMAAIKPSVKLFLPFLRKIAPELSGWKDFKVEIMSFYRFLKTFCEERLESYQGGSGRNPMDFIDVYIQEIKRTVDPTSSFYGSQGKHSMIATLQDVFIAGAETTGTALRFASLYLSVFPEKQAKLHEELDNVLRGRFPALSDRPKMPYTESVILETLRFSALFPYGILHSTLGDMALDKYRVPKKSIIVANIMCIHHDPEIWGDPETFRPERFIQSSPGGNGDVETLSVIKHEALIPFSVGKRVCPGEAMAKDQLFIFIASIFQSFEVTWDPSAPKPSLGQVMGLVSNTLPHKLVFKKRI